MSDESILAAMRHCRDVLATNGFETDAVTLNNAIRALKRAESTALRPGDRLPGGENMVMPVEPTEAMLEAISEAFRKAWWAADNNSRRDAWRAMLAAAQGGSQEEDKPDDG